MNAENPTIVFFDAVGTIICTSPDVVTVYHDQGAEFGSKLSREAVAIRFKSARQQLFGCGLVPGQLRSSEVIERALWRQFVEVVFDDLPCTADLFDSLWNHFANPANWTVYDDVRDCWSWLRNKGIQTGIASNFDSRLNAIVKSDRTLRTADFIYCSSQLGFRKPDLEFYHRIEQKVGQRTTAKLFMVGDDRENDYLAPQQAGWQAFWINRKPNSSQQPCLESLSQLAALIK